MVLGGLILLGLVLPWVAVAAWYIFRLDLRPAAAFLYAPLKLVFRIRTSPIRAARAADGPVIYAVIHQSRLDPALMLALLPPETLHILDERAARSTWMEPFRELARTIAFNAEHVFVSRRLVRHLRGRGRLAVYIPDLVEPDAKAFRLHRAVARIAATADARIVPIVIAGSHLIAPTVRERTARLVLPRLRIMALEAMTLNELAARSGVPQTAANAFFDRLAETRVAAGLDGGRAVFSALRDAARDFGPDRIAVEDVVQPPLTHRRLFAAGRFLGGRLASLSAPGEAVGMLLPNSGALAATLVGLFSAGRVAAMLNYTAGQAAVTAAVRTATIRTVISSRAFVAKAELGDTVKAVETGGAKVVWIEDIRTGASAFDRLTALLLWRRPIARVRPGDPAVILFTSGSEALPKAVVLSNRNLLANALQVASRLAFTRSDSLLNPLPLFHSFGLTGGTILPLLVGVRLFLYPSPLHYRLIPETAAKAKPTILVGTDTFLNAYARAAKDSDFASLRLVVAGAEPVKAETRRIWKDRFGADIVEGFGLTEASPVVAVNTATHGRHGTVGRMMPGMRARLEAVEGVTEGGRRADGSGSPDPT